ncbi:MAG TPA: long-chain-fatty-acid--CoA ligase, partial [Thermomicrobiales bacterium]|nr:long-chain-fatty-acid--CoA ligase [Thermomicrobiales bacterium]
LRLHPDDLAYIIGHAGDRALLVDATLLPLYERVKDRIAVEHVVVIPSTGQRADGLLDYEELLADADPSRFAYPDLDENSAMAMCYTSGTTGRPKGVVYSHRSIVLHSMGGAMADTIGIREDDVVLPVVPMFHANAWGLPFTCTLVGATQVLPGPHLDPVSLLELFAGERVTITAGVPTIWLGMLQVLDKEPGKYDLSAMRGMVIGGAAVPESLIRGYQERHGLTVIQGWGMTETAPVGSLATLTAELRQAPPDEQYAHRAMAGLPMPFVEIRARSGDAEIPWDGRAMGELEVRGPWVARAYHDSPEGAASFTADGWFRTGDIVSIHPRGYIEIRDRAKDVIKSGGEWISSVALENALMGHPAVAEAAVIAVPHPQWQERPLACVVLKEGQHATAEELRDHLAAHFAKWQLPDEIVFVAEIPKTSTGKFQKAALRERFAEVRSTNDE